MNQEEIPKLKTLFSWLLVIVGWTCCAFAQERADQEILYPGEDFAKLDTFEGLNLEDADKLFIKKDFKGAYAAYKAYSFEFAKSPAPSAFS
jgi:hypothetical protein